MTGFVNPSDLTSFQQFRDAIQNSAWNDPIREYEWDWDNGTPARGCFTPPSYLVVLQSIAPVLTSIENGGYSGDYHVIFEGWGYLVFGYGSCSGCDELEACGSIDDVVKLRDSLVNQIKWYNSKEALVADALSRDWDAWHDDEKVKEWLRNA